MKPILLKISGWGPYKELQTIEFEAFFERGIFLVTGATGSGKTTIFDAIAYALYGNVSGAMREKDTLRSDFAQADTQTFVEFTFSHLGNSYRIYRNPEYLRPKKRKMGTQEYTREKERAVYYLSDGAVIEGNSEVTKKTEEILCMDYRQFKQISMIAQGEFIKLLTANQKEKTEIFREIFDTFFCENFTQTIKKKASYLATEIMQSKKRMEEIILHVPIETNEWKDLCAGGAYHYALLLDYLKEAEKNQKKQLKTEEEKASQNQEKMMKLLQEIEKGKQINSLFQNKEDATTEYEKHMQLVNDYSQKKQKLEGGKKAQELIVYETEFVHAKRQEEESLQKILSLQSEWEESVEKGKQIQKIYDCRDEIVGFLQKIVAYETIQKEYIQQDNIRKSVECILLQSQKTYVEIEEQLREKRAEYQRADEAYKRAMIGVVARLVKEGEPCPVCGATKHPDIAKAEANVPNEEDLEMLKEATDKLNESLMECHTTTIQKKGEYDALQQRVSELQTEKKDCETYLRDTLLKNTLPLAEINSQIGISLEEILTVSFEGVIETLDITCNRAQSQLKLLIERETKRRTEAEEKQKFLLLLKQEGEVNKNKKRKAEQAFEIERKKKGYLSYKEYEEDRLEIAQIRNLEAVIEKFEQTRGILEDYKKRCEEAITGLKPIVLQKLEIALEETKVIKDEQIKIRDGIKVALVQIKNAHLTLEGILQKMHNFEKEYAIIGELEGIVLGKNTKRLLFEQYVLTEYFDAVLEAANSRMLKMTFGRFALYRAKNSSDGRKKDNLEMEVLDYYTGKYRSVKTLSGGEIFNTSLSLALGLSDVIQANNGGVLVETLFIDEGFGALDEKALEQACDTLMHLTGGNRMIGIISHVQGLKEKIGNQIMIEKTSNGSSIRLQQE